MNCEGTLSPNDRMVACTKHEVLYLTKQVSRHMTSSEILVTV